MRRRGRRRRPKRPSGLGFGPGLGLEGRGDHRERDGEVGVVTQGRDGAHHGEQRGGSPKLAPVSDSTHVKAERDRRG